VPPFLVPVAALTSTRRGRTRDEKGIAGGNPAEHDAGMAAADELIARVGDAFALTRQGQSGWADPHPDRSPRDDEYSRVSDAAKWRIIGARADAWMSALVDAGLARIERDASIEWRTPIMTVVSRIDRVVPVAPGALPLVIARSRLGSLEDAGVTLAVGDPAVGVAVIPDCGCDACDSGSQDVLDVLDSFVLAVVSGEFRRLSHGDREITVRRDGWSASGGFRRREVESIIADSTGWFELSGTPWSDGRR
jgi:hypothetical protein